MGVRGGQILAKRLCPVAPSGINNKGAHPAFPLIRTQRRPPIRSKPYADNFLPSNAIPMMASSGEDADWTFINRNLEKPQIDKSADNASTSSEMTVVDILGARGAVVGKRTKRSIGPKQDESFLSYWDSSSLRKVETLLLRLQD